MVLNRREAQTTAFVSRFSNPLGNAQQGHDLHAGSVETWGDKTKTFVKDVIQTLREEEVLGATPSSYSDQKDRHNNNRRNSWMADVGADDSSLISVLSRTFSPDAAATQPRPAILLNFHCTALDEGLRVSKKYKVPVFSVDTMAGTAESPPQTAPASAHHVLSHPLLVEAAETLFMTVAPSDIYEQEHVFTRVLDTSGNDLTDGSPLELFSVAGMTLAMVRALKDFNIRVPVYLKMLLEQETGRIRLGQSGRMYNVEKSLLFGVHDAHEGEVLFAGMNGVIGTLAGHIDGRRVVQVTYNSSKVSVTKLVRVAVEVGMAQALYYKSIDERIPAQMEINRLRTQTDMIEFSGTFQADATLSKHALRQTLLKYIPLTSLQAARANRLVANGKLDQVPDLVLSPRQAMLFRRLSLTTRLSVFKDVIDMPIRRAWKCVPARVIQQVTGTSFRARAGSLGL